MSLFPFRPLPHDCEWIGGRYVLSVTVGPGNEQVHPTVDIWMELPRGVIVAATTSDPRKGVPLFAASLEQAMKKPAEGSPRRPARIRVAEERLAEGVRKLIESDMSLVVAPVPELDAAIAALTNEVAKATSYLAGGTVSPEIVARFFSAAHALHRAAPWRAVGEGQLLRVDIPALQVDGACLAVVGPSRGTAGLLLFRSLEALEGFPGSLPAFRGGQPGETIGLSLSFERKKHIPPAMHEEIEKHGWQVAGANAYPVAFGIGADADPTPAAERDYQILTASALAFLSFFDRHRGLFQADEIVPVRESIAVGDELTVTLTAPYEATEPFEPPRREPRFSRARRQRRKAVRVQIVRLKVTLRHVRPPIWRRIEVRDDVTLARLHDVLQVALSWYDCHLHSFRVGEVYYGVPDPEWGNDTIDEKKVPLRELIDDGVKRFVYEYDFGDGWEHDVVIEGTGALEAGVTYPRCLKGKRAIPPEDCGGPWGYGQLLRTLANPRDPDYKAMRAWAGQIDPEDFDLDRINARLKGMTRD